MDAIAGEKSSKLNDEMFIHETRLFIEKSKHDITRPAQHSFFNDAWNSHDEMIFSSKIKKDIKKPFEYVWIKKHIMHLIKEV